MATETSQRKDLIACIAAVLDGKADTSELESHVANTRQEIAEHRLGFTESLGCVDTEVRDKVQPFVDACQHLFDAYDNALHILDQYLASQDRHLLVQGAEHVRRVIFQLSRGFQAYRDAVLIAQGPTDIPNYNLLLQAVNEWKAGQPVDKLRTVVERERIAARLNLNGLGAADTPALPEVLDLKNAFRVHAETATRLGVAVRDKNEAAIDGELEHLRDTFVAIRRLFPVAETAVRSQGPSPSGLVNLVVNTAHRVAQGDAGFDELGGLLSVLKHKVRSAESLFEILTQTAGAPARLEPTFEKGRQAFSRYEDGFQLVDAFFSSRVVEVLQRGLKVLVDASQVHHAAEQAVLDFMEQGSKMVCVKCAHGNRSDRVRCERCGATLPLGEGGTGALLGEPGGEAPVVSDTLRRVYYAINGVADGSLAVEKYRETIAWFEELVTTHLATVRPLSAETQGQEVTPEVEEAIEKGEALFDDFKQDVLQAIIELKAFADDANKTHLLEGIRLCNKSAQELLRIERSMSSLQSPATREAQTPDEAETPAEAESSEPEPDVETEPSVPDPPGDSMIG